MSKGLEGKIVAPRVVFCDKVSFKGFFEDPVFLDFVYHGKTEDKGFSLKAELVQAVYDADGKDLWINPGLLLEFKPVRAETNYDGLQVVFTDQVVYKGAEMGAHHFTLLKDREDVGHNKDTALDISYGLLQEVHHQKGILIWQNFRVK